MRHARVLIIDDERDICILLSDTLSSEQWNVEWTTHPFEALERVKSDLYELIILDIKMPEISGLELLPRLKKESPETAVMIMSAYGNIPIAIQAMKEGAEDYLEKPFRDLEEVRLAAVRLVESARVRMENRILKQQLEERFNLDGLVSASPPMQEVFSMVRKVAPIMATVLLTGETGTGKGLIARILHRYSKREMKPFISVNCGGLPEGLLESLLFGHEKGSFTGAHRRTRGYFEEADGGTLFLDEVGDMPAALQVKLLRVLQERTFQRIGGSEEIPADVRMIAATNKDLEKEVEEGRFRQDLYYRMNVITISLPALRDRREDVPLLARYFVDKYSKAFGRSIRDLTPDAISHLCNYEWPGNVRQLENVIERAVALCEGPIINAAVLSDDVQSKPEDWSADFIELPIKEARQQFERQYLIEKLRRHGGNVTLAARSAGLPRQNYHRRMKSLGLPPSRRLLKTNQIESEIN